jgi:hypothetical protein
VRATAALLALLVVVIPGAALGFSSGVPTGYSGAPGDDTCADCHGNLNNGSGGATITAPYSCSPGDTIEITVDVHQMGQKKWGFELTCLDGQNEPAGSFIVTDPGRTQLDTDGDTGREYMMHTSLGNDSGHMDMCLGWTFEWVAPAGARPEYTFYVASVAANNGSGAGGDYVYTAVHTVSETPVESGSWSRIKQLYR